MILEQILTATALILVILPVRALLGRRMGARLRYALWLPVLLRLLLPVSFGAVSWSPANFVRADGSGTVYSVPIYHGAAQGAELAAPSDGGVPADPYSFGYPVRNDDATVTRYAKKTTVPDALPWVWLGGMGAAAVWFGLCNGLFRRNLKKTRKSRQILGNTRIYTADVPSPCVFGLVRPAIYVTEAAAADEKTLAHVLLHETTHLRRGDQLWAALRTVCLVVWWFHPLVWLAAALSRKDCELACDEAVICRLGPENRAEYGKTLLALAGNSLPGMDFCAAATLSGGKTQLRQRICAIVRWSKPKKAAMLLAAALALAAAGCAFLGGSHDAQAADPRNRAMSGRGAAGWGVKCFVHVHRRCGS